LRFVPTLLIKGDYGGLSMRTLLKKVGLAAAVALTVAASAGAAQAQHWRGHHHGGYYRGGFAPGFVGGLAVGSALGYGYANCARRVWFDRFGRRHVRRVCY
jgi:hypothetical protein